MLYTSHGTFPLFPSPPSQTAPSPQKTSLLFSFILKIYKVIDIKEVIMNNFLTVGN